MCDWPIQGIPNRDALYFRVHRSFWRNDGSIRPAAFREQRDSISMDWERYSTPEESRWRGRKAAENGIVSLVTGDIRSIEGMEVEHRPLLEPLKNRAHTEVRGLGDEEPRKTEVRARLHGMIREIEIHLNDPVIEPADD